MSSKRALLVGINYVGTDSALNGCWNDVKNMKEYLISTKGYKDENIVVITDEKGSPTRANIIKALVDLLLSGAEQLFFHYSGHGSYVRDNNGDEADGKDECLVGLDFQNGGMITDDEIRGLFCLLRSNQRIFCVLDCCHSGTGMDLKYNLYERFGGGRLAMQADTRSATTEGVCIMLSGCMDAQTSADAYIAQTYQGALTATFLGVVKSAPTCTYEQLVQGIRKSLKDNKYSQIPMLSSGRQLSLSEKFTM